MARYCNKDIFWSKMNHGIAVHNKIEPIAQLRKEMSLD
jgi:hypothetical protein